MQTRRWLAVLATVLLALPLAVACDDDPDPGTDAGVTDAGTTDDDAGGPMTNTIADIVTSNPDFSMLAAAATQAGIAPLLASSTDPAPFTIFAPTNEAFAASGITMAMIEGMTTEQLTGILTYHAIPTAELASTDLVAGPARTAAGLSIIVGTEGGVTINGGNTVAGGANVVTADIEADNGIIHVIDRVLLPPTVADLARYAGLTSLVGALDSASLVETLSDPDGEFTVFAPTNAAFTALGTAPTGDALTEVLLYHVVGATVPSSAVPGMAASLATRSYTEGSTTREVGLTLLFDTSDGVAINGGSGDGATNLGATVVIADVFGLNGVVHVIDSVLLPLNIAQVAIAGGFSTLVTAVTSSDDIPGSLVGGGADVPVITALSEDTLAPLTVFAPTDAAFTSAFPGGVPTDGAALLGVLGLHVIPASLPVRAADLPSDSTPVSPLAGSDLVFDTSATPPTVTVSGGASADITGTDIGATNGIVHVIDNVLTEGS